MNNLISRLQQKNVFDEKLMLGRALLAISSLITLSCNNINEMINTNLLPVTNAVKVVSDIKRYSIFEIFDPTVGKIVGIAILLLVLSGYIPKISCLLHAWVALSIQNTFLIVEGGDQAASNLCMLLIPLCILDTRINQWQKPDINRERHEANVFANTYYFLLRLQVSVIYLDAAIGKLIKPDWLDGTSLYYWVTHNTFGAPIWLQNIYRTILLTNAVPIFTWSVIILELALFACILATDRAIRRLFLVLGLSFHLMIILNHGLISFYFSMAGALVIYLAERRDVLWILQVIKKINFGKNANIKITKYNKAKDHQLTALTQLTNRDIH